MVSSLNDTSWLQWVERLLVDQPAPATTGADLPPSRFYCRLDDQPDHLTPQHALAARALPPPDTALVVNPACVFTRGTELPEGELGDRSWLEKFALPYALVWVPDPSSKTLLPFWLGPHFSCLLDGIEPGQAVPPGLPPRVQQVLTTAGVFLPGKWDTCVERPAGFTVQRASRFQETRLQETRFREKGYVPLPQLLHPFHLSALRRYYRHMIRTGGMDLGDSQSARRFYVHNDGVACFFHYQLTALVSELAGEPVKPSYVYVASYQEGADLKKHVDREQCEFSITLSLDYSPEPRHATPWPLQLHTDEGEVTVFQALGDGLLYRGRQLAHSRSRLPAGHSSTSIFFHYVREDFTGPLG